MKFKIVNGNRDEVREQATNLLWEKRQGSNLHTTEITRYSISYPENHTLLDEATGNYEREEEIYSIITDEETGAKVLYFHVPTTKEDYYRVVYFAPEEWGRYTKPFKNLPEETLYIAILLNACFVKPVKGLSPDEALTATFVRDLNAYFGVEEWTYTTKEEYTAKVTSIEDAFKVEDEEIEANPQEWEEDYEHNIVFLGSAPVSLLSELSGVKIKNVQDYKKALKKYLNVSTFDKRQERAIDWSLNFELRDTFVKWLIYEFMRTEDYNHLKECLKEFKKFLLPKDWAKDCVYLNVEPEEYVISKYLSKDALSLLQRDQLRAIAKETNTPLSLILKASKNRIWDF